MFPAASADGDPRRRDDGLWPNIFRTFFETSSSVAIIRVGCESDEVSAGTYLMT